MTPKPVETKESGKQKTRPDWPDQDGSLQRKSEVHCVSSDGSFRRADIIAINGRLKWALVLDPTIRFERNLNQATEVDIEKKSIYEPCLPYLPQKYNVPLKQWSVIGLLFGSRGSITKFTWNYLKELHIPFDYNLLSSTQFTAWYHQIDSATASSSDWRPDPTPACDVILQSPQISGICSQFICLNLLHPQNMSPPSLLTRLRRLPASLKLHQKRGRPPLRWMDNVELDLYELGISACRKKAKDRDQWKIVVKAVMA
ncbi:hypothetical protein ANN_08455 [Periplaneta americana]|uniref:Uncharacterized protein n=1 Tax=Periplaneta americana TaxID=6978 RepID=A0ABQ8T2M3_PERAM|nr:hypothetical protein ANN_08455 [Periplaneta americana]